MPFESIPGQERAKEMLRNSLRKDKVSHAYLFHGPAGTGKKRMAVAFAQAIYCTELQDDACGTCLQCRKIEHGNHPELLFIEPEGAAIKIEQIRSLQKSFSYRSSEQQPKTYIIEHADRMTVQAANSLLKFLEEPQSKVVALLLADNGQALLPTIRSRVQWIPFSPISPNELIPPLLQEGYSEPLVRAAAHLTSGLSAARELIQLNVFAEARNVVIQLAKECSANAASAMVTAQQKVMKTEVAEHFETLMDLFVLWYKDLIHLQYGLRKDVVYTDQVEWLSKHAYSKNFTFWVELIEEAMETKKRLRYNANPQLALEHFMVKARGGE